MKTFKIVNKTFITSLILILMVCCRLVAEEVKDRYLVTFKIKESHISLNIMTHIKDASNAMELTIPVDKQFYDDIQEKQELKSSFKSASLWLKGSFGSYKVIVMKKEIVKG